MIMLFSYTIDINGKSQRLLQTLIMLIKKKKESINII